MTIISVQTPDLDNIIAQYANALQIRAEMLSAIGDEPIVLDFSEVEWIGTAELTPLACTINQFRNNGYDVQILTPDNRGTRIWFNQIDFPEGSLNPNSQRNHLPLCQIPRRSGRSPLDVVGDRIRELLKRQLDIPINAIFYTISEIINNVEEHSDCDNGYLMVQNYPKKRCVDICVVDDGISIPGSYESYDVPFTDDIDAVRKAMEEGVSTKGEGRGYGLRTTANLVCDGLNGDVVLSSRDGFYARHRNQEFGEDLNWDGTTFIARVYPPGEGFNYTDYIE